MQRNMHAEEYACRGICMQRNMHAEEYACRGICMQRNMHAEEYACRGICMQRNVIILVHTCVPAPAWPPRHPEFPLSAFQSYLNIPT